ncbi:MAG: LptA/OstA family protein [Pseudomonadota bacterium]
MIARIAAILMALLPPFGAAAQGLGLFAGEGDDPIEIDASEGIEWRRDEQLYLARGDARATRGDVTVEADVLIARYRDAPDGGTEIFRLDAVGNVQIYSPNERAVGDNGVYDVDEGVLVLTGSNLRFTTPTDVITARDSLEYWERRRAAVARGNAVVRRDPEIVSAETLQAFFTDGAGGGEEVERVEGFNRVCVFNGRDVARGAVGRYNRATEFAELEGDVVLTSGESVLRGERAEIDFRTGVSRLVAEGGRVRGRIVQRDDEAAAEAAQLRAAGCP